MQINTKLGGGAGVGPGLAYFAVVDTTALNGSSHLINSIDAHLCFSHLLTRFFFLSLSSTSDHLSLGEFASHASITS